jgi:hypothetical protein
MDDYCKVKNFYDEPAARETEAHSLPGRRTFPEVDRFGTRSSGCERRLANKPKKFMLERELTEDPPGGSSLFREGYQKGCCPTATKLD